MEISNKITNFFNNFDKNLMITIMIHYKIYVIKKFQKNILHNNDSTNKIL